MTNQTEPRKKNTKLILGLAALVLVVAGLLTAKIIVENKIKAWAREDLSLYEPMLHLESAQVEASVLWSSVTYKDVVYSIPEAPELKITIEKISEEGLDRDTLMGRPGETSTMDKIAMTNLRMLLAGQELPIMEIGHYEVADVKYPYREIRAALLANKGNEDLDGLLKSLWGTMRTAEMSSGPAAMRDLRVNMRQMDLVDFSLGLLSTSSFRELDPEVDGFDAGVDNILYKDFTLSGNLRNGSELLATLAGIEVKGLKYNYKQMLAALDALENSADPVSMLLEVLPSLYNYQFDECTADKLEVKASGVIFTLDKFRLGPRTLKEQGPNTISGLKMALNGMEIFSLEAIGLDKLVLSDPIVDFLARPKDFLADPSLLEQYSDYPISALRGLALENLYLKNLNVNNMLTLGNWRSDLAIEESVKFDTRLDKLHVSKLAMSQISLLARQDNDLALQNVIGLLAQNPEGLTLDGGMNLDLGLYARTITCDLGFDLDAQNLGAWSMGVEGKTGPPELPYEPYGPMLVDKMEFSVEDKGLLNLFYEYLVMQGFAKNVEDARNNALVILDAELDGVSEPKASLLQAIRGFLSEGGKLGLVMRPESALPSDDFDLANRLMDERDDLADLGLSVTYSK